jgi:shikimate kinase
MGVHTHYIYLNGMMGVGKSSVGLRAALDSQIPFIDLDSEIEKSAGQTISTLFKSKGEAGFRKLEAQCLRSLKNEVPYVLVSVGGGAPSHYNNMSYMNDTGTTILLYLPIDDIINRLKRDHSDRPMLQNTKGYSFEDNLRNLYHSREKYYNQCKFTVHNKGTEQEVINKITVLIRDIMNDKLNTN